MVLFSEHADVSVRPALPTDAARITALQVESWRSQLAQELGTETLDALDLDAMEEQWKTSITAAPSAGFSVLTALHAHEIVGYVAVAPSTIVSLEVSPLHQREGHGSRLLTAAVDRLQQSNSTEFTVWIPQNAQAKKDFYASAGLAPDGCVRQLQVSQDRFITEERWSALL